MSAPPMSERTVIRDVILGVLENRRDKSIARVTDFQTSKIFLSAEETLGKPTYCVLVTDEAPGDRTHSSQHWGLTVKVVIWANHHDDPHSIVNGMIEDLCEAIDLISKHPSLENIVSSMKPESITGDERTTQGKHYGQAVCVWSLDHER